MAAQFGKGPKNTNKTAEKGGVEAPRSITLSTPILLLSLFSRQSGKPIFRQNRSIAQQRLFFEARLNMSFFVRAGLKTGTHEKWQVSHTKGRAKEGVDALLNRFG